MRQKEFERILRKIANQNHTTVQQVREEMQFAMEEGQKSGDPQV